MAHENIVLGAFAIYLGFSLHAFFDSLVKDFVAPLINSLSPTSLNDLDKQTVVIGKLRIKYGDILSHFIQLAVAGFLIYLTLPYARSIAANY
jgi:large-conductance mechanosensitive channel